MKPWLRCCPENWTEFGLQPLAYAYDQVRQLPVSEKWWAYLPVHKADRRLIGSCGYKGLPDEEGVVEIGYEISPPYRRRGLAGEIARALVEHASRQPGVRIVQAHTLAQENPSVRVLKNCGFAFVQEIDDPDDGRIWQWRYVVDTAP